MIMTKKEKYQNYAYLVDAPYLAKEECNYENAVELIDKLNDFHINKRKKIICEIDSMLNDVMETCKRLTTGDVAHCRAFIQGRLNRIFNEIIEPNK